MLRSPEIDALRCCSTGAHGTAYQAWIALGRRGRGRAAAQIPVDEPAKRSPFQMEFHGPRSPCLMIMPGRHSRPPGPLPSCASAGGWKSRTASWYSRSQHQFADSSGRSREPTAKVVERGLDVHQRRRTHRCRPCRETAEPECELASALQVVNKACTADVPLADGPADRLAIRRTVVTLPLSVAPSAIIGTAQPCCPYQRHGYRRPQQPARYAQSNHQPDLSSLGRRSPTGLMNFHVRSSGAA